MVTKMAGIIKNVFYVKGISLFIFIGMILILSIQQGMIFTPKQKIADFADDMRQNSQGIATRPADKYVSRTGNLLLQSSTSSTNQSSTSPTSSTSSTIRSMTDIKQGTLSTKKTFKTRNSKLPPPGRPNSDDKHMVDGDFCPKRSAWNEALPVHMKRDNSDMKSWKFNHTVKCPDVNISKVTYQNARLKLSLNCKRGNDSLVSLTRTNDTSNIYVAPFGDECVGRYIKQCCTGHHRVPKVVHYVWYMRGNLSFVGFTSLISVIRFVKPCAIIFHGDNAPQGPYWDYIVNMSPNIIHLKRERPQYFSGQKIKHREHSSDIMRIEALLQYGGIYMDTDTIIVKSIDALRKYPCVMSNQSSGLMGSAFVMSEKNSSFLQFWMDGYHNHYNSSKYAYNAMVYPKKVAREHRDLIHIEYATVSRPINMIGGKIYYNEYATYDWSYIYGIHLYSRIFKKPFNEFTIRTMNTTVGSICRHVIFGNKELCN